MVLGDPIKKLRAQALFPVPEVGSLTTCIDDLFADVENTLFTSSCEIKNPTPIHHGLKRKCRDCVVTKAFDDEMTRLESRILGLNLNNTD